MLRTDLASDPTVTAPAPAITKKMGPDLPHPFGEVASYGNKEVLFSFTVYTQQAARGFNHCPTSPSFVPFWVRRTSFSLSQWENGATVHGVNQDPG